MDFNHFGIRHLYMIEYWNEIRLMPIQPYPLKAFLYVRTIVPTIVVENKNRNIRTFISK